MDTRTGQAVGLALAQFLRVPECVRHACVALVRRLLSVWSVRLDELVWVIQYVPDLVSHGSTDTTPRVPLGS